MYSPYLNVCSSARLRVHAFPQNPNDIFRLSMFSRIALRFHFSLTYASTRICVHVYDYGYVYIDQK